MEDLQNEANPFIIISQTKIWTGTVNKTFLITCWGYYGLEPQESKSCTDKSHQH